MAVAVPGAPVAEAPERLDQLLDLFGGDCRPGVAHPDRGLPGAGARDQLDPAAGDVVVQRVVYKVRDQALGEIRVARGRGRSERRSDAKPSAFGLGPAGGESLIGE